MKKHLHHYWTFFRAVKPVYIAAALAVMLTISIVALRHNNQTMGRLREAVYTADKNNGDVEGALRNLREYVYNHMNTDLSAGSNAVYPPIQLKYTYEHLLDEAQAQAKQTNADVYTQAQAYCEKLYPDSFSGGPRVPCIRDYVSSHGVQLPTIPDSLYKFDFTAPTWSPDLAGWSLVVALLLALWLAARLLASVVLRRFDIL